MVPAFSPTIIPGARALLLPPAHRSQQYSQGAFGEFPPAWQKGWVSHYEHSHFDINPSLLKGILTFFSHTQEGRIVPRANVVNPPCEWRGSRKASSSNYLYWNQRSSPKPSENFSFNSRRILRRGEPFFSLTLRFVANMLTPVETSGLEAATNYYSSSSSSSSSASFSNLHKRATAQKNPSFSGLLALNSQRGALHRRPTTKLKRTSKQQFSHSFPLSSPSPS